MRTCLYYILFGFIFLIACSDENELAICNSSPILADCSASSEAQYCLFGYKWGEGASFDEVGEEAQGPGLPGGVISYSFQNSGQTVSYHLEQDIATFDFDTKGQCARDEIRNALEEFLTYGDFSFEEMADDSPSDIRFYVVDQESVNIGSTNFQDPICSSIAGQVVFTKTEVLNCDNFYILSLHEIGHVMGLGHVGSSNIMSTGLEKFGYLGLFEGDIAGIVSLYGEK